MKNLIKNLKLNSKVQKVNTELRPSLEIEDDIKKVSLVIKTESLFIPLCKYIGIKPTDDSMYLVDFYCPKNPNKTVLKELYEKHNQKLWVRPRSAHENPMLNLKLSENDLYKIINYIYSTIN